MPCIPTIYHQYFVLLLPEGMIGRVGVGRVKGMILCDLGSTLCSICFHNSSVYLPIVFMSTIFLFKERYD